MNKKIISIIMLLLFLIILTTLSGCLVDNLSPIWIALKSVGGDNGFFPEGQEYNFTLYFGYSSSAVRDCEIAVITATNTNNDTAEKETRTFVIDDFSDEKYYKPYKDSSAVTLNLSYPAPKNQPCTGGIIIEISGYIDKIAQEKGECLWTNLCTVHYLAESGVGTIVSYQPNNDYWKRRCDILLSKGKLTRNEYNSEMHKLQEGASTGGQRRGISSEWTDKSDFRGKGDVHFIETLDNNGIVTGTFSATTDNKTVAAFYLSQLDSGWYNICYGKLYKQNKQIFYLTAETENGVETWFIMYYDGKLTISNPVSGWSGGITFDYIIVTDSQNGGTETYYKLTDDLSLPELEIKNP